MGNTTSFLYLCPSASQEVLWPLRGGQISEAAFQAVFVVGYLMLAMSTGLTFFVGEYFLKQKPSTEPAGNKVQTDDFIYVPAGALIVPGAAVFLHKK